MENTILRGISLLPCRKRTPLLRYCMVQNIQALSKICFLLQNDCITHMQI